MGRTRRTVANLLKIAAAEIGYHEKLTDDYLDQKTAPNDGPGNHTKYARDLFKAGYYNGDKCGFAWCDVFVDWLFYELCDHDAAAAQKMEHQSGPYGAACPYSAQYYKDAGRFYESDPQPGDQIFFGDFSHTGIVESVRNGIITTIEGNTNNMVARREYVITDSRIAGYGRPTYEEDGDMNEKKVVKICEKVIEDAKAGEGSGSACSGWAEDATRWAVENGIVSGFGGEDFGWKKLLTREQMAVMLYSFAKLLDKV